MTFYCNDCGRAYDSGDEIRQLTVRCQECLHESGDCWKKPWPCELCRAKHAVDGHHPETRTERYCQVCVELGYDHPKGKEHAEVGRLY